MKRSKHRGLESKLQRESKANLVRNLVKSRSLLTQKEIQVNNLQFSLDRIHTSKFWKLWQVYKYARSFLREPYNFILKNLVHSEQRLVYRNAKPKIWPKDLPLVSVIIPCFNYGRYLIEAIDSVRDQTLNRKEIIVINDGSDDPETIEVLEGLKKKGIKVIDQENRGVASARNIGILEAKGKYVCCLDPDDYFAPTYLEKCLWLLETNLDVGFAYSWAKLFDGVDDVWETEDFSLLNCLAGNTTPISAVMRKEAWLEAKGYRSDVVYEDWNLWISIGKYGWAGKVIPEVLFFYRVHGQSKTNDDIRQHEKTVQQMRTIHRDLVKSRGRLKTKKIMRVFPEMREINRDLKNHSTEESKIAVFVPWVVRGGADKVLLDTTKSLCRRGYSFILFTTLKEKSTWIYKYDEITGEIFDLNNFLDESYWADFCESYLEKIGIKKVIISQSRWAYPLIKEYKKNNREIKVVDIIKNSSTHGHSDLSSLYANFINKTVVPSKTVESGLIKNGVPRKNLLVLNDGIDLGEYKIPEGNDIKHSKVNLGLMPQKRVITFLGRFSEEKDPLLFLQIAKLFRTDDRINFILVGEGPLEKRLKSVLKRDNLTNTKLITFQEDVNSVLAATDILLNTSKIEGVPLTIMEAFAKGVPTIAPKVGGIPDLVPEEFLVEGRRPEVYADAIKKMLSKRIDREKLRSIASEKANIEKTAVGIEEALK